MSVSYSYNKIMENIKKKREGFTNKSTTSGNKIAQKRSNQKQQAQKGSNNLVWGHFVAQTVHMIVYFWIFFPFWSCFPAAMATHPGLRDFSDYILYMFFHFLSPVQNYLIFILRFF